jgi:endonuclease/exonuclease/phosphatase family metal-dependent hydrolase
LEDKIVITVNLIRIDGIMGRRRHKRKKSKVSREESFILDVLAVILIAFISMRYIFSESLSLEWFLGNQVIRFAIAFVSVILVTINLTKHRSRPSLLPLIPIIIVIAEIVYYVPFHKDETPISPNERVRVLTFNAATSPIDDVVEKMVADSVDIACIQELYVRYLEQIMEESKLHGYQGVYTLLRDDAGMGTVILSKTEILTIDTIKTSSWGDKIRRFSNITTNVHGHDISIVSMQLESFDRNSDIWGLKRSWELRGEQAHRISDVILDTEIPMIVAGDLNSTATNRAISPLLRKMRDTWKESGSGLGATWHRKLPLFRIDYILTKGFSDESSPKIIRMGESDHLAYQIDLKLPDTISQVR